VCKNCDILDYVDEGHNLNMLDVYNFLIFTCFLTLLKGISRISNTKRQVNDPNIYKRYLTFSLVVVVASFKFIYSTLTIGKRFYIGLPNIETVIFMT